ncbi:Zn-ribbon domain-containing OB-fold protein [Minwuia sp.]|uniref:Zn-ribbon domain-containing OB-fold protein n=1 Tax=Minwuia sp. TaxID=2493630 RepID=UPI003A9531A8
MAYFPESMPGIDPTMDEAAFFAHCRNRELKFQACGTCGQVRHPPTPVCFACHSTRVAWIAAPPDAEVFSFTVVHYASHPAVSESLPYVVGLVTFPDMPGVKLVTNITDVPTDQVHVGMRVSLWWDDVGEGLFLPRYRPAQQQ